VSTRPAFCEAADAAIRAAGVFRYPPAGAQEELEWPNQDVWDLAEGGTQMVLDIARANIEALLLPDEEEDNHPQFCAGDLVQIRITVQFAAKLVLLLKPPVDRMILIAPSYFMKGQVIGEGTTILPNSMPERADGTRLPKAFKVESKIGWHNLIAIAVEHEANVELPRASADEKPRVFEDKEFALLFERLRRLRAGKVQLAAAVTSFFVAK